jgi:hypothetical protein
LSGFLVVFFDQDAGVNLRNLLLPGQNYFIISMSGIALDMDVGKMLDLE